MNANIPRADILILIAETALVAEGFRTLGETLDRICRYVHDLFKFVDVQIRTLTEEGTLLRVGGHAGISAIADEILDELQAVGDETMSASIAGRLNPSVEVYRSARPLLVPTTDYRSSSRTFRSLSKFEIGSTYFAPIIREARVVGVMACHRREAEPPDDVDRELIAVICRLTGISLATARIADESKRISRRLEEVRSTLETDNLTLRNVQQAQGQLIQTLAEGGATTLEQVARALASTVNRSVVIVDRAGTELALVSDAAQEPVLRRAAAMHIDARRTSRPRAASGSYSESSLVDVGNGAALGGLILAPAIDDDDQFARIIARQASMIVAAHLQAKNADATLSSLAKPFALLALSRGIFDSTRVSEVHGLFDMPDEAEACLVMVKTSSAEAASRIAQRETGFATVAWPVLSAVSDREDVLILVRGSGITRDELRRFLGAHPTAHAIGSSSALRGLGQLPRGRREAGRAAKLAESTGGVAQFAEFGMFADLAAALPDGQLRAFVETKLGALRDYDREKNARLVETLDCYLRADRAAAEAAGRLGIHVNTLHQRLRRIETLAHVDLRSLREVAQLLFALDWAQTAWSADSQG